MEKEMKFYPRDPKAGPTKAQEQAGNAEDSARYEAMIAGEIENEINELKQQIEEYRAVPENDSNYAEAQSFIDEYNNRVQVAQRALDAAKTTQDRAVRTQLPGKEPGEE